MPPAQLTLGTGLLSGRTSPARARRIVEAALDSGITRVDTARAYGDGETEHLLGAVLRRRPDVVVVTKAGLGPLRRQRLAAARWRAASPVVGMLPSGSGAAPAAAGDEEADDVHGTRFDVRTLRASIDSSRRALRRDRLDLVLLHEFDAGAGAEEAAATMDDLVREGAVAAWGVGTRRAALRRLADRGVRTGSLVQTTGGPLLPQPPSPAGSALSVHSVLGPGGALLSALLAWLPGSGHAELWTRAVGPLEARRTAGAAVLRAAVSDPAVASVLLSTRDPRSIARTVSAVSRADAAERSAVVEPVLAAFRDRGR